MRPKHERLAVTFGVGLVLPSALQLWNFSDAHKSPLLNYAFLDGSLFLLTFTAVAPVVADLIRFAWDTRSSNESYRTLLVVQALSVLVIGGIALFRWTHYSELALIKDPHGNLSTCLLGIAVAAIALSIANWTYNGFERLQGLPPEAGT